MGFKSYDGVCMHGGGAHWDLELSSLMPTIWIHNHHSSEYPHKLEDSDSTYISWSFPILTIGK